MNNFNLFIPITKVDVAKREVYGLATAELVDKAGEIFDYASSVPYYKEWSGEIAKASGGKSLGNVREMHSSIAAGKLTHINFNDEQKQIEVCAKIVDDSTWNKVLEGVLTGFSHGGEYIKRWKDDKDATKTRYTAKPAELSVVDNPCLGEATFEMIRMVDGKEVREMVKFKTVEPVKPKAAPEQVWKASDGKTFAKKTECEAHELALEQAALVKGAGNTGVLGQLDALSKALDDKTAPEPGSAEDIMSLGKKDFSDERRKHLAGTGAALPDGSFPIESEQDLKNAIHAIGRAKDPEKAKAHIKARAKALGHEDLIPSEWGGSKKAVKPEFKKDMQKGMSEIARTACLIQELHWLVSCLAFEADNEGDGSNVPDHFRHVLTELLSGLEDMVTEEVHEMTESHAAELMGAETMEMAVKSKAMEKFVKPELFAALDKLAVEKAGARHSAADKGHLSKAMGHLEDAKDHHEEAVKTHGHVGTAHEAIDGAHAELGKLHKCMTKCMNSYGKAEEDSMHEEHKAEMKGHLKAMGEHLDTAGTHLDKAERQHGKMGKAHDGIAKAHEGIGDALAAVGAEANDEHVVLPDHRKAVEAEMQKLTDDMAELKKKNEELEAKNTAHATENGELTKTIGEVGKRIPELLARINKLETTPLPGKGALYDAGAGGALEKGHGVQVPEKEPVEAQKPVRGLSPEAQRRMFGITN